MLKNRKWVIPWGNSKILFFKNLTTDIIKYDCRCITKHIQHLKKHLDKLH